MHVCSKKSRRMYSQLLLVAAWGQGMGSGGVVQYIAEFKNTMYSCVVELKK